MQTDYDESKIRWTKGPLELGYPHELANLLSTGKDNVVVYFYKPNCPYCLEFNQTYKPLASNVHRTNLRPGCVPIVMTQIDGDKYKDEINQLRPGFLGDPVHKRGYPTILFARPEGVGYVWDPNNPRTEENLCAIMSVFFQDPSLMPVKQDLTEIMNNPNPEFVYFYLDAPITLIPRFIRPLDPDFTSLKEGIATMTFLFLVNPELREKAAAFPIDRMDQKQIQPSIWDNVEKRSYAYRDAHRWLIDYLSNKQRRQ
jgi:thiol-disulfide isomerase/thioredoxin